MLVSMLVMKWVSGGSKRQCHNAAEPCGDHVVRAAAELVRARDDGGAAVVGREHVREIRQRLHERAVVEVVVPSRRCYRHLDASHYTSQPSFHTEYKQGASEWEAHPWLGTRVGVEARLAAAVEAPHWRAAVVRALPLEVLGPEAGLA